MKKELLALIAVMALQLPALAQTPQQVEIGANVNYGLSYFANTSLFSYVESPTTTAKYQNAVTVKITKNTTNNTVNLTTLFPGITTAIIFGVSELSGVALNVGMASGGTRFPLAANGFLLTRVSGTGPTLYVDNASLTTDSYIQVFAMGN